MVIGLSINIFKIRFLKVVRFIFLQGICEGSDAIIRSREKSIEALSCNTQTPSAPILLQHVIGKVNYLILLQLGPYWLNILVKSQNRHIASELSPISQVQILRIAILLAVFLQIRGLRSRHLSILLLALAPIRNLLGRARLPSLLLTISNSFLLLLLPMMLNQLLPDPVDLTLHFLNELLIIAVRFGFHLFL